MNDQRHVTTDSEIDVERTQPDTEHWLVRPASIRKLWFAGIVVLALTLIAELVFPRKGKFGFDSWFGFAAAFGFLSCVAMVFFAKALGIVLKRPEDHYDS